jgi:hypothetical protein
VTTPVVVTKQQAAAVNALLAEVGRKVTEAFRAVSVVARNVAEGLARLWPTLRRAMLPALRAEHGGNGSDAYRYPDQWRSVVCGAWLCAAGDPCPSDEYRLGCTCKCHGGKP